MSLATDLAGLSETLRSEATSPGSYSRGVVAVAVEFILARQEQKSIGADDAEVITYEQHVLIWPAELGALVKPQAGDRLAYTDASGQATVLEVDRNKDGDCYRMTKSGLWFRVFTKKLKA